MRYRKTYHYSMFILAMNCVSHEIKCLKYTDENGSVKCHTYSYFVN